jgi:putative phosphoesterase
LLALLADIHGNVEALDAVLRDVDAHAAARRCDVRILVAGDVVGYGPDPEACLQRLIERRAIIVRGNHEEMVLGVRDTSRCVASGIRAVAWTQRHLPRPLLQLLRELPNVARVEHDSGDVVVCHGTVDDAGTYVSDDVRAARAIALVKEMRPTTSVLVCGHTHMPMRMERDGVVLVNPGAVGQARDGVVRARYALVGAPRAEGATGILPVACSAHDSQHQHPHPSIAFHDVAYDAARTVEKMRSAGLVPAVALTPPRGSRRHVERAKAIAARLVVRAGDLARTA